MNECTEEYLNHCITVIIKIVKASIVGFTFASLADSYGYDDAASVFQYLSIYLST